MAGLQPVLALNVAQARAATEQLPVTTFQAKRLPGLKPPALHTGLLCCMQPCLKARQSHCQAHGCCQAHPQVPSSSCHKPATLPMAPQRHLQLRTATLLARLLLGLKQAAPAAVRG